MNDYQEKIQFVTISLAINDLNALILLVVIRIRKLVDKTKCNLQISYYFLLPSDVRERQRGREMPGVP